MKCISICVPCYNEEASIELMYNAICEQMHQLKEYDYEIVFADNRSTDQSEIILRHLAEIDKKHVKVILNNHNWGPKRSGLNMLYRTSGDAVIIIPCDFQEPPEMIPDLIKEWEKGHLVVRGQKVQSRENGLMYAVRSVYYSLFEKLSDYKQYKHVTGFGITDKSVIDNLRKYKDNNRGLQAFICAMGYDIHTIPYTQEKRKSGKSSYNLVKYIDLAVNNILQSSTKILKGILTFGVFCLAITFIGFIVSLVVWLITKTINVFIVLLLFLFFCFIFYYYVYNWYFRAVYSNIDTESV